MMGRPELDQEQRERLRAAFHMSRQARRLIINWRAVHSGSTKVKPSMLPRLCQQFVKDFRNLSLWIEAQAYRTTDPSFALMEAIVAEGDEMVAQFVKVLKTRGPVGRVKARPEKLLPLWNPLGPKGEAAARAQFLIGYSHLTVQEYASATQAFKTLIHAYPKSSWAQKANKEYMPGLLRIVTENEEAQRN